MKVRERGLAARSDIAPVDGGSKLTLTHELHTDWAACVERTETACNKMFDA